MWFWIIAIVWWALGTSSMLWLSRGNDLTWGSLFLCSVLGGLGPVMWVVIVFVVLCQADFWSKPIFPKKQTHK